MLTALFALAAGSGEAAPDTLVIAQGADITTLDPTQATQIHNLNLFYNIYDALVTWDSKDIGKVVPELAVSWRSVNPTTWQFKLRQGVKFHNGEPFNAEAAKFTIDRLITKGVHQVYGGFATIERAEVVDPYTINMVTSKPDPILVKRFAGYGGQMLPPQYVKQVDWKDFALRPVGTGPYKFVEWVKDDRVVLEAIDAYWRGAPKIKKVEWRPDPGQLRPRGRADARRGPADHQGAPGPRAAVEKAGCCRVEHTLTNLVTVYLINAQKGPLANTKVRQALNYAVNKDKIIKELYHGYAIPIGSGIPNTDFGFNPGIKPYPYDPAMAKKLLAEAGYAGGVEIELQSGNGIHLNDRQLTEAVAAMLGEVGVRARSACWSPPRGSSSSGPTPSRGCCSPTPPARPTTPTASCGASTAPAASSRRSGPGTTRGRASTSSWRRRASAWTPRSGSRTTTRPRRSGTTRRWSSSSSRASWSTPPGTRSSTRRAPTSASSCTTSASAARSGVGRPARPTPAGSAAARHA